MEICKIIIIEVVKVNLIITKIRKVIFLVLIVRLTSHAVNTPFKVILNEWKFSLKKYFFLNNNHKSFIHNGSRLNYLQIIRHMWNNDKYFKVNLSLILTVISWSLICRQKCIKLRDILKYKKLTNFLIEFRPLHDIVKCEVIGKEEKLVESGPENKGILTLKLIFGYIENLLIVCLSIKYFHMLFLRFNQ